MAKHIVLYVDCSGSMSHIVNQTHAACLTLLTKMQQVNEDIYISYYGFDSMLIPGFTRKKAKYLSCIPSPFARGGTQIYDSFIESFHTLEIHPSDELIFVIASDGGDLGGSTDIKEARKLLRQYEKSNNAQMFLVSLSSDDGDIREVADALQIPRGNVAWGNDIESTLTTFVHSVFR